MTRPFIIYALPRSRTFWVSRFLTFGEWSCGHDELRHFRGIDDVKSWFSQEFVGTVETAGASWWRLAKKYCPDAQTIVIQRSVEEVLSSLCALGLVTDVEFTRKTLVKMNQKLEQVMVRVPNAAWFSFDSLKTEIGCAALFEACLPYRHSSEWWNIMAHLNIQTNMEATIRYYHAHKPQLDKLAKTAKHRIISDMQGGVECDGFTIQQEPFEDFLRDAPHLFAEHLTQVEESPDNWVNKNIPLMRLMDQIGAIQITTARSNGRMFGYLMAIISPSWESPNRVSAAHATFFASKDAPGIGLKLQRSSIDALRAKGVDEIFMRAGPRGSGPKMGALYRRLGATDAGHMFELQLEN